MAVAVAEVVVAAEVAVEVEAVVVAEAAVVAVEEVAAAVAVAVVVEAVAEAEAAAVEVEAEVAVEVAEVEAGRPPVVTSSDQSTMSPISAPASSTMYSSQVPFAVPPLKVDRLTFPLGVGAGPGNGSPGS